MKFRTDNIAAITGLGIVAPGGIGISQFWRSLCSGRSAIRRITRFDPADMRSQIAGEVEGFNPQDFIEQSQKPRRMARHTQLALAATKLALRDAGLMDMTELHRLSPIPIAVGLSVMDLDTIGKSVLQANEKGAKYALANTVHSSCHQSVAGSIREMLSLSAEMYTVSTACASGLDAIGMAARMVASGRADIAIAGGTEAPISLCPFQELTAAGLCSFRNDDPEHASRPFDAKRDSGVVSEGAGFVIIENLENAWSRGARPYAIITGYANRADTDPAQPCMGFTDSMLSALADAGRTGEDVDYISAWGPGHPVIDRMETVAIKNAFGSRAYQIPVSSIKGMMGNPLGAAGAIQAAACAMTIREGIIPPTANYEVADPECDLDYVPTMRHALVQCALVNAHGVGGGNSTLVLGATRNFERASSC